MPQFLNAIVCTANAKESYGKVVLINPEIIGTLKPIHGSSAANILGVKWDDVEDSFGEEVTVAGDMQKNYHLLRHDLKDVLNAIAYLRSHPDVVSVYVDDCPLPKAKEA